MKVTRSLSFGLLALLCAGPVAAQVTVYDNLADPGWTVSFPTSATADEFGDEIILANGTPRILTSFTFQYNAQNLTGGETVEVSFYQPNGPLGGAGTAAEGFPTPGTAFYTSQPLSLSGNGQNTLTLNNLNVTAPDDFIWTVKFNGVSGNKTVGLAVNGPQDVGYSFPDYWKKTTYWDLASHSGGQTFGAQFMADVTPTVVPEPLATSFVFAAAALLSVVGVRKLRRNEAIT